MSGGGHATDVPRLLLSDTAAADEDEPTEILIRIYSIKCNESRCDSN